MIGLKQEQPEGTLTLQTLAMPKDTNPYGDIFGGWLMSQMDIAGAIHANAIARGRVTTVAVSGMRFIRPVTVGAVVSCYCETQRIGNTSVTVDVEVWASNQLIQTPCLVTQGTYVYVALDEQGNKRAVKTEP
jgi:acyl-CoA thioesterase YciA